MSWITIGSTDFRDSCSSSHYYGTIVLQYDDTATGTSMPCRLYFNKDSSVGSVSVYLNNLTIAGTNYGQKSLNQSTTVIWSGNINGNQTVSASWSCPWYCGTKSYSLSGWLPTGGSLPTGLKAEWVSSTWNSVTIKSSVTSWGSGYTGTPEIQQIVVDSSATSSNWETKGRQVRSAWTTSTSSSQAVTWNGSTGNSTSYSGGITIKGAMDLKVAAWAVTSVGTYPGGYINASTTYHTPPAPLQTLSYTQTQGATNVTVNISITGGTSTNNYGNTVTTQYCYSVNGGSYSSWASAGTGTAWTAKTASFTVPYNASVTVKARQVYNSLASEEKSVSFTSTSGTAPSSLSSSIIASTWNSVTMSGSCSYGNPSSISGRSLTVGVNINGSSLANRREKNTQNVTSVSGVVIDNSSSNLGGTFDLKGMLAVYPFAWASNTVQSNSSIGSVYYLPPAPGQLSYTLDSQTPTTKVYTVSYTGVADNNITDYTAADLNRTFRYSTDGGSTWTYVDNAATKTLTTVSSFTITLNAQDSVQVEAYLTYKTKNSTTSTLTITNSSAPVYLYGSVNGETAQVIKLYGSANGETVKIKKLYGSVNGVSRLVYDDPN